MDTNEAPTAAVETLADAMMQSAGQIQLILDHMLSYEGTAPDADPIPVVLKRILAGTLEGLVERHPVDDIATAAQMLTAATQLIGEEVYLVPQNRSERRRRRRGSTS